MENKDILQCTYEYKWYAQDLSFEDCDEVNNVVGEEHNWDKFMKLKEKLESASDIKCRFPMEMMQKFKKNGETERTVSIPLTEYNFKQISESICVWNSSETISVTAFDLYTT